MKAKEPIQNTQIQLAYTTLKQKHARRALFMSERECRALSIKFMVVAAIPWFMHTCIKGLTSPPPPPENLPPKSKIVFFDID